MQAHSDLENLELLHGTAILKLIGGRPTERSHLIEIHDLSLA